MKIITLTILILFSSLSYSQNKGLINKDKYPSYELMKSGKFVQEIKHPKASPGYYMIIQDSIRTEYSENGKYFTKSKLFFISPNNFKSIAYESTVPGFTCHLDELVETKILETSTKDSLVTIKERIRKGKWKKFVLRKVKS